MAAVQIRGTVLTLRRVDAYHALTLAAAGADRAPDVIGMAHGVHGRVSGRLA